MEGEHHTNQNKEYNGSTAQHKRIHSRIQKAKSQERDTLEKFAFQIHSKAAQVGSQNSMLPKIKILKNSAQDNLLAHNKYT